MSQIHEIQKAVESLSDQDYKEFRQWFYDKENNRWEEQIKRDSESGVLDFLIKEVREEKKLGNLKDL